MQAHKLSSKKITITKEELNNLPLKAFEGKIDLITDMHRAEKAFREIDNHNIVGFDTETRPSFYKGQHYDVTLMQLAIPDRVFLIRLKHTGIINQMISFFENDKILKAGVGLRDDVKALQKLKHFRPEGFLELSNIAKQAGLQVGSVKKLTGLLLGFRISKGAQTSNWEAAKYSEKQISYAATDAWVCLELYRALVH